MSRAQLHGKIHFDKSRECIKDHFTIGSSRKDSRTLILKQPPSMQFRSESTKTHKFLHKQDS